MIQRIGLAVRPVVTVLRRAAPRSAAIILSAQLLSGVATAWALLLTTQVLGQLLAEGPNPQRLQAALPSLVLLGLIYLLRVLMDAGVLSAKALLVPKVRRIAEEEVFRSSLQVDLACFDDPGFYDRLHRAHDRGVMHMEGATDSLVQAFSACFVVAGAAAALLWLHPVLLVILVVALLPEGWAAINAARVQYGGMPATIALTRKTQMLAELATQRESAPEIRANQAQGYVLAEYSRAAVDLQDHLVRLGLAEARLITVGRLLSGLGLVGTFIVLGFMLQAGWVQLAVAGTAVIAIRSTTASLATLMQMAHDLFEKGLYISDYREFIDEAQQYQRTTGKTPAPERPGRIELHAVSFRYPGNQNQVALDKISFAIDAGQSIALVGENGSGKTTLAKLIAGLYAPTEGRITWDGIDLQDMDAETMADRVVMVQQQPLRWPRSARDNVRLGRYSRVDPEDSALLEAARHSRALEVIEDLPEGWQTLLSREFLGGQDLSAGQWQRLAVARGLYRDAPLVIWDEPTAPLDAKAEYAVYESLRRLARDRTTILITHRLASIRHADRILFLENGKLLEQGRHDELLQKKGRYAELWWLQMKLHGLDEGDD